jgi:hypothetical protein
VGAHGFYYDCMEIKSLKDTTECTIKIPSDQITMIRDSIAMYGSEES